MVFWFASCGVVSGFGYVVFIVCFSFQKTRPQKTGHSNPPPPKKKMQTRKDKQKKSVSAVVFTNSVSKFGGWATKMLFVAENL